MELITFQKWPSIPRLFRDCIVTEKIDGTNAAVGIQRIAPGENYHDHLTGHAGLTRDAYLSDPRVRVVTHDGEDYAVYAQSRSRILTVANDNHGFARYVYDNAGRLVHLLGEGLHFGEWWGSGIQRGYGLEKGEKRLSLFNVKRWEKLDVPELGLACVPVLWQGAFSELVSHTLSHLTTALRAEGSAASPGFMRPEGMVIYHNAAGHCFKYTPFDGDGHKGVQDGAAAPAQGT